MSCGHRDMSITRSDGGLLYHCYRASCAAHDGGFLPTSGALLSPTPYQAPKLRPYYGEYHPLTDAYAAHYPAIDWFKGRFEIEEVQNVGLNEHGNYVFEILDPYGRVRGYLVREVLWGEKEPVLPDGSKKAKTRVWMHSETPSQSWYVPVAGRVAHGLERTLVVVEDVVSGLKLRDNGIPAVSLLGTDLNLERVRELSLFRPTEVILALDQDAASLAFKLARRWSLAFNRMRVALLDKDIKDTPRAEIREVLGI